MIETHKRIKFNTPPISPPCLGFLVFDEISKWDDNKKNRMLTIFHGNIYATQSFLNNWKIINKFTQFLRKRLHQPTLSFEDQKKAITLLAETIICDDTIDLSPFVEIVTDKTLPLFLPFMKSITSLSLAGCCLLTDKGIKKITTLKALKSLTLSFCPQLTHKTIANLACMQNLEELDIRNCKNLRTFNDDTLLSFTRLSKLAYSGNFSGTILKLTKLTHLTLFHISESKFRHLKYFANLKSLQFDRIPIDIDNISTISTLTNLKQLKVLSWNRAHEEEAVLSQLTNLEKLEFICAKWYHKCDYNFLTHLTGLRCLKLRGCTKIPGKILETLTLLSSLDITFYYHISDEICPSIGTLSHLKRLCMKGCNQITDKGIKNLSRLAHLEFLDISCLHEITNISIQCLSHLKLRELTVDHCSKLLPTFTFHIKDMTTLEILDIAGTLFNDSDLQNISGLTELISLDISESDLITDSGIQFLSTLSNLRTFHMNHCLSISDPGIKILKQFEYLEGLGINSLKEVTDKGFFEISQMVQLKKLYMTGCIISNVALQNFKSLRQLIILDLSYCPNPLPGTIENLKTTLPQCLIIPPFPEEADYFGSDDDSTLPLE